MHSRDFQSELDHSTGYGSRNPGKNRLGSQQLYGCCSLQDVIGDFRIHDRHSSDIEDHHLSLLVDHLDEHGFHNLVRALRIDGSHDRAKKDAVVNLDDWRGQLADCRLVAGHRLKVGGNVRRWPGPYQRR